MKHKCFAAVGSVLLALVFYFCPEAQARRQPAKNITVQTVKEEPPAAVVEIKNVPDVFGLGKDAEVAEGTKTKEAVVFGGDLKVDGEIDKSAVAIGGSVILGPKAVVGGDVVSIGGSVRRDEKARVKGKIFEMRRPRACPFTGLFNQGGFFKMFWILKLITFIGFLGLAILAVSIIPRQIGLVSAAIETRLFDSVLWGIIAGVLLVPVALLLMVSIVGILLIPFEALAFLAAAITGYISVSQYVGKKITIAFNKPGQSIVWETLIGISILFIVGLVPFIGWMIKICVLIVGIGGVAVAFSGSRANPV
jgi:hypothetical protein